MVEGAAHRRRHRAVRKTSHRKAHSTRRTTSGVKRKTTHARKRVHRKTHSTAHKTVRKVHRRRTHTTGSVALKTKTLVQLKRLAKQKGISTSAHGKSYKKSTIVRLLSSRR